MLEPDVAFVIMVMLGVQSLKAHLGEEKLKVLNLLISHLFIS